MQDQIEAAHLGAEWPNAELDTISRMERHTGCDLGRGYENIAEAVVAANDHGANADHLDHFAEIPTRGHCIFPL
jgi:hypothetical protein